MDREQIEEQYKWDLTTIYESDELYLKLKNASIPSKPRGYDDDAPIRTPIVEELKSLSEMQAQTVHCL